MLPQVILINSIKDERISFLWKKLKNDTEEWQIQTSIKERGLGGGMGWKTTWKAQALEIGHRNPPWICHCLAYHEYKCTRKPANANIDTYFEVPW